MGQTVLSVERKHPKMCLLRARPACTFFRSVSVFDRWVRRRWLLWCCRKVPFCTAREQVPICITSATHAISAPLFERVSYSRIEGRTNCRGKKSVWYSIQWNSLLNNRSACQHVERPKTETRARLQFRIELFEAIRDSNVIGTRTYEMPRNSPITGSSPITCSSLE